MERHVHIQVTLDGERCEASVGNAGQRNSPSNHLEVHTWQNSSGVVTAKGLGGTTFFYTSIKAPASTSLTIRLSNPYLLLILNGPCDSQWAFASGQAPLHIPPFALVAMVLPAGAAEVELEKGASGFHCFGFSQEAMRLLAEEFEHFDELVGDAEGECETEFGYLPSRFLPPPVYKFIDKLHKTDKRAFALNLHCKEILYQIAKLYHASLMTLPPKPQTTHDDNLMRQAVDLIQLHFSEPTFTVDSLAKRVGLSRRNLYRLFSYQGQPTPQRLILSTRLEKAKTLFQTTSYSVSEIAAMVGFNHLSYFAAQYKGMFGHLPNKER